MKYYPDEHLHRIEFVRDSVQRQPPCSSTEWLVFAGAELILLFQDKMYSHLEYPLFQKMLNLRAGMAHRI